MLRAHGGGFIKKYSLCERRWNNIHLYIRFIECMHEIEIAISRRIAFVIRIRRSAGLILCGEYTEL